MRKVEFNQGDIKAYLDERIEYWTNIKTKFKGIDEDRVLIGSWCINEIQQIRVSIFGEFKEEK